MKYLQHTIFFYQYYPKNIQEYCLYVLKCVDDHYLLLHKMQHLKVILTKGQSEIVDNGITTGVKLA